MPALSCDYCFIAIRPVTVLTGDSDVTSIHHNLSKARIILSTPEKWDAGCFSILCFAIVYVSLPLEARWSRPRITPIVTRKRRENNALIGQIALLLIDEGIVGKHSLYFFHAISFVQILNLSNTWCFVCSSSSCRRAWSKSRVSNVYTSFIFSQCFMLITHRAIVSRMKICSSTPRSQKLNWPIANLVCRCQISHLHVLLRHQNLWFVENPASSRPVGNNA